MSLGQPWMRSKSASRSVASKDGAMSLAWPWCATRLTTGVGHPSASRCTAPSTGAKPVLRIEGD